jgi:hypothetical protein
VIAIGIGRAESTAQFWATSFSANVVTEKITIVKPFDLITVPMVSSCTKLKIQSFLTNEIDMLNEMTLFYTWFKFPRNVAAHALCGERWAGG